MTGRSDLARRWTIAWGEQLTVRRSDHRRHPIGLAVIDDRLYRRADLDQLNIAVLAVIPRGRTKFKTKRRKQAAS